MEQLVQNLWLNSVVVLLVSLGEIVFLYGLSREVRKVNDGVQKVSEEVRYVGEMGKEVAQALTQRPDR